MKTIKFVILSLIVSVTSLTTSAQSAVTASPGGKVAVINQEQFASNVYDIANKAKKSEKLAIVDFNAKWCGPCRQLAPILDELAAEYKGKVEFYSIDIDQNKELARSLGIKSIPYVVFYPINGKPHEMIGLEPKEAIKSLIDADLAK